MVCWTYFNLNGIFLEILISFPTQIYTTIIISVIIYYFPAAGQTDGQKITVTFLNFSNGPQVNHYLLRMFFSQYKTSLFCYIFEKRNLCIQKKTHMLHQQTSFAFVSYGITGWKYVSKQLGLIPNINPATDKFPGLRIYQ